MAAHSLLSPSSAYRWLKCSGCIELVLKYEPDSKTSPAAEYGTRVHEYAEQMLSCSDPADVYRRLLKSEVNKQAVEEAYSYVKYVWEYSVAFAMFPAVENRVDLSSIYPDTYGTVDAILVDKSKSELHVFDLKTGMHKVDAKHNPQLLLYAYGVVKLLNKSFTSVVLHIYQNNIRSGDNTNSFKLSLGALLTFINSVKQKTNKMKAGEFQYIVGDHCKYCNVKQYCKTYLSYYKSLLLKMESIMLESYDLHSMDLQELEDLLSEMEGISGFLDIVKNLVKERLLTGEQSEMYKLQYKKSPAKWNTSEQEVLGTIQSKNPEIPIDSIAPRVLLSPSKMKKSLPAIYDSVVDFINQDEYSYIAKIL